MAISFIENIEELQVKTEIVEGEEVKVRKIRITATRIDDVTGSRIPAKEVDWAYNRGDVIALAVKVGNKIAAQIPTDTAKLAVIADYKGRFHTYLTERPDLK